MNRYALLGHKLSHSQSKIIHEYFFEKNGIDADLHLPMSLFIPADPDFPPDTFRQNKRHNIS